MDSIVGKLSEIESAAVAIVDHAESQKAILENEMQEKRDRFDAELKANTEQRLLSIQNDLEGNMSHELDKLKQEHIATIESLNNEYKTKHEMYAHEIIKNITEV